MTRTIKPLYFYTTSVIQDREEEAGSIEFSLNKGFTSSGSLNVKEMRKCDTSRANSIRYVH